MQRDSCAQGIVIALLAFAFALGPDSDSAEAAFGPLAEDQRVSFMGPNGDPNYGVFNSDVAYNRSADEYLVVWVGDDNTSPLVNNEFEVFAQRLSGSGAPLGGRIRVSTQGMDGDVQSSVQSPAVAYNPVSGEYLVAWMGEIGTTDNFEVWTQRISAAGAPVGGINFQISSNLNDATFRPTLGLAANAVTGDYLATWVGTVGATAELEIFGERLTAAGAPVSAFRVSEQGADGVAASEVLQPVVASNPVTGDFLVAWAGEIGTTNRFEIWAQRLSSTGAEVGGSDFQVSDMGGADQEGFQPRVAVNPAAGEYLVIWVGDDDIPPLVNNELEVFGQRLTASGAATGADDFRISEQGANGVEQTEVSYPSLAYDSSADEYLVAWTGEIGTTDEFQTWAQRLSPAGAEVGGGDFQVSNKKPPGYLHGPDFLQASTAAAANPAAGEYLVVWEAEDPESEIYARRFGDPPPTPPDQTPPPPGDGGGAPVDPGPAGGGAGSGGGGGGGGGGSSGAALAFGTRTLVTLKLAAGRIPARGPLKVRVTNGNAFAVSGRLSGQTTARVSTSRKRRVNLTGKFLSVRPNSAATVNLALPKSLRRLLQRKGKLSLRLTAKVGDPAGNTRTVTQKVTPKLKRARRR